MLSLENRIDCFSHIWKSVSLVFYNAEKLELDKAYKHFLKKIIKCKSNKEYYLLLTEFVNLCKDGHTKFTMPKKIFDEVGYLPFNLIWIDNKYYICDSCKEIGNLQYEQIVSINGKPFGALLRNTFKYIYNIDGFAGRGRIEKYMPFFLKKTNNIMLLKSGTTVQFNLLAEKPKLNLWIDLTTNYKFDKIIENNIKIINDVLYIKIESFGDINEIENIISTIKNLKYNKIIFDLRDNKGGMTFYAEKIINLFINKNYSSIRRYTKTFDAVGYASASQLNANNEKLESWIKSGLVNKEKVQGELNYFAENHFREFCDKHNPDEEKIDAKIVLLTSRFTVSAAEDFVAKFKINKLGFIVGNKTYGSTGTPYIKNFDDGSKLLVCSVYSTLITGEEFINQGIRPDLFVSNSIKDYKRKKDLIFEKALDLLK